MSTTSTLPRFSLRSLLIAVSVVSVVLGAARIFLLSQRVSPLAVRAAKMVEILQLIELRAGDISEVMVGLCFDETAIHPQNSWRYGLIADAPPISRRPEPAADPSALWSRQSFAAADDQDHQFFCLHNSIDQPRSERYARIMSIRGDDAAFDYLVDNGLDALQEKAPESIVLVEVANSQTPWMQRGDLDAATLPRTINPPRQTGIGSDLSTVNFLIAFADGEIWALAASLPFDALAPFLTMSGSNTASRADVLGPYRIYFPTNR